MLPGLSALGTAESQDIDLTKHLRPGSFRANVKLPTITRNVSSNHPKTRTRKGLTKTVTY